jgi:hypothetical protein
MTITDGESLRTRIREIHETEPSRFAIRKTILDEVQGDPIALAVIAEAALLGYVTRVIRVADPATFTPVAGKQADSDGKAAVRPTSRVAPVFVDGAGNRYASPNIAARADLYLKRISVSVKCGPNPEDEKFLRDLDASQLRFAAGLRRAHADAVNAVADTYESLARALEDSKVATVAQLDPETGLSILTGHAEQHLRQVG